MTELNFSTEELVFVPVGGATGVGMNCFAYGLDGKWLVVDCGIGFPDDNLPGVDCLLPDSKFLSEHKADIIGLVITHAHEDHIGAIPYLWHDLQCPIYCTAFAKELIDHKLMEAGLLGRAEVHTVTQGDIVDLPPFEVEFVKMTHSIPEPNALAIRTKAGMVVHTGDWRFEENASESTTDYETLKELGKEGVLAVVCDSTNTSEEKVKAKKVLEINPDHDLFKAFVAIQDQDDLVKEYASVLYDEAMLLEGRDIANKKEFVRKLNELMIKAFSK